MVSLAKLSLAPIIIECDGESVTDESNVVTEELEECLQLHKFCALKSPPRSKTM